MYNVSVGQSFIPIGAAVATAPLGIEDVGATAAVHGEYLCVKQCVINRIMFQVQTIIAATTTPPQVRFSKRLTSSSDTGAVVLGSLIIPDTTAAGKMMYKDIKPVVFQPGQILKLENTVQAVGGGASGTGYYAFEAQEDPEDRKEETNFVLSA